MTLVRVRRMAQLTLPAEVRRALNVKEGDYLDAEIVDEGVLLKPVAVVERDRA
ncbi:MAG: AbrB/MazE/SpoVT family DNA-binding domain-containing protein [Stellaceae bacterium]